MTELITPYKGGEPGSSADAPAILPVENGAFGGKVIQTQESQRAASAAAEFSQAMPEFTNSIVAPEKKGINNLDADSTRRLAELRQRMRSERPKPATVVNLHPWPLQFGGGDIYLRGILIPACNPGQPFAFGHIRSYRVEKMLKEDGTNEFSPMFAIRLAGEFLRQFSNADIYGGGIIIYEGEKSPDKTQDVETYDQTGRLLTVGSTDVEYDEEDRPHRVTVQRPIYRPLSALIDEQIKVRNNFYLQRVKRADQDYNRPDGKGKALVNNLHCLMADVLFAEGIISAVPKWDLKSAFEEGLKDNPCPACGSLPKADSFKCMSCGHILNPFDAYMGGAIEYGHASMDLLSGDEWEMVEKEKVRRAEQRAQGKKAAKAVKPEEEKPKP